MQFRRNERWSHGTQPEKRLVVVDYDELMYGAFREYKFTLENEKNGCDNESEMCPYFINRKSKTGSFRNEHVRPSAEKGISKDSVNDFLYSEPSGPLFEKKQLLQKERIERPPELVPTGAIALRRVMKRDPHLSCEQMKKDISGRVCDGICDASGFTKPYELFFLVEFLKKVPFVEVGRGCCEFDATGSRLGAIGVYGSEPPQKFDEQTFEPKIEIATKSEFRWPDEDQIHLMKKKRKTNEEDDQYEAAVFEAQTNTQKRSLLLAYIFWPVLYSPVHNITVLILDDCGLLDQDAQIIAQLLRARPPPTSNTYLEAEDLRRNQREFKERKLPLGSPPIRRLSLRLNFLTDIGVMLLKKAVKYHPIIEDVLLEGNNLIRAGEGFSIPPENLKPTPSFLIPFFDSDAAGGNEEILELRHRLDRNRSASANALQRTERGGCFHCFF